MDTDDYIEKNFLKPISQKIALIYLEDCGQLH